MENLQPVSSEDLDSRCGLTAELDEMWSDVRSKANPRWLWHAIDHHSGQVLAYVFGRRQDTVFLQRQALLEPFGIPRYDTDGWGAYERHIDTEQHRVGKDNTQKIASKHMNLRTGSRGECAPRSVSPRRTICTISSLGCSSIAMNLGEPYETGSTPLRHLQPPVVNSHQAFKSTALPLARRAAAAAPARWGHCRWRGVGDRVDAAGGRRGGPRAGQACARADGRGAGTSGSSGRDGVKSGFIFPILSRRESLARRRDAARRVATLQSPQRRLSHGVSQRSHLPIVPVVPAAGRRAVGTARR